jgi:hypothetical protein
MADGEGDRERVQRRREVLGRHGARGALSDEVLEVNRCLVDAREALPTLPLPDEPHLEAWRAYGEEAERIGVWEALRSVFVQLRFPIREGISREETYRRATLRGEAPDWSAVGAELSLRCPQELELSLHRSIAGTVPILVARRREDFETLVRAFSARNEPVPVPDAMGACMVSGLNNWDRIDRYRQRWQEADETRGPEDWPAEFRRLIPRKELYQDRLVILSRGPYSGVSASDVGLEEAEWLARSFRIRREHECTHYFTLRVFGRLQHNLLEELVADFVGTLAGFEEYREDLALRFLGLEDFPTYRVGGRLEVYRGDPPISDEAFEVLASLCHSAILSLGVVDCACREAARDLEVQARLVYRLTLLTLEELAAEDAADRLISTD